MDQTTNTQITTPAFCDERRPTRAPVRLPDGIEHRPFGLPAGRARLSRIDVEMIVGQLLHARAIAALGERPSATFMAHLMGLYTALRENPEPRVRPIQFTDANWSHGLGRLTLDDNAVAFLRRLVERGRFTRKGYVGRMINRFTGNRLLVEELRALYDTFEPLFD